MITASQVKELREKTGAGMMDCKKALTQTDGDIEKAIDWLRENGAVKSAKKMDRIAAEGLSRVAINGNTAVLFEMNSETDFVAKNEKFLKALDLIQEALLQARPATNEEVLALNTPEGSVNDVIIDATATIGEKISFRRFQYVDKQDDEVFGAYMHMGGKISSVAVVKGGDEALAKNIAMQVASMAPVYKTQADIPSELVERETALQRQMMAEDASLAGKPEKVLEGILKGKVSKHFKEICLADQEFFLDPKSTVAAYLKSNGASVTEFVRYMVGEGIEKKEENFAEEVMAQIKG